MALSASLYGGTPFLGTAMGIQVLETHRQESTPYICWGMAFGSQHECMGGLSSVHACFMSCFHSKLWHPGVAGCFAQLFEGQWLLSPILIFYPAPALQDSVLSIG